MEEQKSTIPRIVMIIGAVVVVVAVIGLTVIGTINKKKAAAPTATKTTGAAGVTPSTPSRATTSNEVVPMLKRDSVLRSVDSGATFESYFSIATATTAKIGTADVLSISFHPTLPDRIVVTTPQDGLFLNEGRVNKWASVAFPPKLIYSFILDNKHPDSRVFASGVVSGNGRIFRTDDAGQSWRAVYAEPGSGTYISGLTQDPKNPLLIVGGTNVGTLVRSTDGGDTWKNIGQTITGYVSNFTYDSTKSSFMYMLLRKGKIYHSTNGGLTWLNWEEEKVKELNALKKKMSDLSRAGDKAGSEAMKAQVTAMEKRMREEKAPANILYIVADPLKSGTVYVSTQKGIYRSVEFGKYWKPLDIIESAQAFPIPSVAINPKDSNELSFVAGKSFYRSVNKGVTWSVTPLNIVRNASFVAYDPFDPKVIFIGLSGGK